MVDGGPFSYLGGVRRFGNTNHMVMGLLRRHLMGAIYAIVRDDPKELVKSLWALVCLVYDLDGGTPEEARKMPDEVKSWIEGREKLIKHTIDPEYRG